ncbi:MAG: EAL domain-containing protein [Thermodesulfobacteriota bacterium]
MRTPGEKEPLVLVVDDDGGTRLLAAAALAKAGYRVAEAEDGDAGVAACTRVRPDLVLMDAVMPGTDGFSAVREIRKLPGGDRVPVVMMTGLHDFDSIHKAYEAGVTDFVTKPINWTILGYRVGYILRASRAFLDLARSEEKTRALLRAIPDRIFRIDADGGVLDLVECEGEDRSPSDDDLAGRRLEDVLPAEAAAKTLETAGAARETGRVQRFEYALDDGTETRNFEARVVALPDGEALFIARDNTDSKRAEERLTRLAYHDALTGLPNRVTFREQLEREIAGAKRRKEIVGVILLDLDHFKEVNDTLGHAAGDRLLVSVADRLRGGVRETDTVARISGDEFCVILPGINEPRGAVEVCRRLKAAFAAPFVLDGQVTNVTASLGIAMFPEDGETPDDLVRNADIAMFRAKAEGRDTFQVYSEEIRAAVKKRVNMEKGLRAAGERNEFVLHYQPEVELTTGRIVGAEALVRWQSPDRGLLTPLQFLPIAEETGDIVPLSEWIIRTACLQAKEWRTNGHASFKISVNVSARLFRKYDLAGAIRGILEETAVAPETLALEITESTAIQDLESALKTLWKLHGFSIRVAMDDFGTGYSSLACLRKLPIRLLKVDQAFIRELDRNPGDQTIVKAILAMAEALGIDVVAEGVERAVQRDLLRSFGCRLAQGYYFSRPVPAKEFSALLASRGACIF